MFVDDVKISCWEPATGNRRLVTGSLGPTRQLNAASAAPSRLHRRHRHRSRSRRREHVFICMFYPSAALNPTHPDRKVRSAARRARAVAASRSPPATTVPRSRTDSPAKLCPKSTGADARRVLIATASGHRNRTRAASRTTAVPIDTRLARTTRIYTRYAPRHRN